MKTKQKDSKKTLAIFSVFIISLSFLAIYTYALPSQPSLEYISNETSTSAGIGTARAGDLKGTITTINISASQQNFAWKAYVGNVSGKLVLEDAGANSIFEWDLGLNSLGNVFISRNGTVDWGTVNCSDLSNITQEDIDMNLDSSSSKSINQTFSGTTHKSFDISGDTYQSSTCPAISTYVSDASQASGEADKFQEVLLSDASSNLIYMAMMEQDEVGFDGSLYDFQVIVAENEAGAPTTYYFYLELA